VNTEQKVKPLMDEIVKIIRSSCFLQEYQEQATVEECVGMFLILENITTHPKMLTEIPTTLQKSVNRNQ